jgi:hypothetical protein
MKTIIAGSRNLNIDDFMDAIEACPFVGELETIVSGTAKGIDQLGEEYAQAANLNLVRFPADWQQFGRAAGFIRNKEMAEFADSLIAIWDGKSPGTKNMIANAKSMKLRIFVWDASIKDGWIE